MPWIVGGNGNFEPQHADVHWVRGEARLVDIGTASQRQGRNLDWYLACVRVPVSGAEASVVAKLRYQINRGSAEVCGQVATGVETPLIDVFPASFLQQAPQHPSWEWVADSVSVERAILVVTMVLELYPRMVRTELLGRHVRRTSA